jgi:PPOX class probable F420-dependent enzyme
MTVVINDYVARRLRDEQVIWLTTVRADGAPLPTPVWFWWNGATILIFSQPGAQKVKNIVRNARVALNFNSDAAGGNVVVLHGEAHLEQVAVPDAYFEKYRAGIVGINMTPETLAAEYSTAIRIRLAKVRAWE